MLFMTFSGSKYSALWPKRSIVWKDAQTVSDSNACFCIWCIATLGKMDLFFADVYCAKKFLKKERTERVGTSIGNSIFAQTTYMLLQIICKLKGLPFNPFKSQTTNVHTFETTLSENGFYASSFFGCLYRKVCLSKRLSHFAQKTCYKHQHKSLPMMMMINRASQKNET